MPLSVQLFAKRAFCLLFGWLLIYHAMLRPARLPDKWLTNTTTNVTVILLNQLYRPGFAGRAYAEAPGTKITLYGNKVIYIADGCNALELYVLFTGFLFCLPAGAGRMAIFAAAGMAAIFVLNISRCYALTWMVLNRPGWVDFAHHYVFTLIVYACIFGMWVWYSKKHTPRHEKA
jgi:exosortase/archaeosortase family protein